MYAEKVYHNGVFTVLLLILSSSFITALLSDFSPSHAASKYVSIVQGASSKTDSAYNPNPVEIRIGDKVIWENDDSTPHTATSGYRGEADGMFGGEAGSFGTIIAPGKSQSFTFNNEGEFPYFCGLHPNMAGVVIVEDPSGTKSWYVGEGVRQDMYVKYRIQEFDTNNGRPYEMTIYFEEQEDGDWFAPVYIVDSKVLEGTLRFGNNLAPLGGSSMPPEMNVYIGGYRGSLQWLEAFSPEESPKSLTASSWGKLACIGCEDLKPQGAATVTVQAGTYDTTLVGWHRGQTDSKIWIMDGFPYPIKAETYVDVTTGTPPIQFKFELLETGSGEPDRPEIVSVDLTLKTDKSVYRAGETVRVTGSANLADGEDLAIAAISPSIGVYKYGQIIANDGSFEWSFILSGNNVAYGQWTVEISYAGFSKVASFTVWDGIVPDKVAVTDVRLVNSAGSAINSESVVGSTVAVSASISNNQDYKQPFVYIVQVVDDNDGSIVMVSWLSGSLEANQTLDPAVGWRIEEAGDYMIDVFVWSSLSNPEPLAGKESVSFTAVT